MAIHDREDSEEIFDLADVAQALGCLQVALHSKDPAAASTDATAVLMAGLLSQGATL